MNKKSENLSTASFPTSFRRLLQILREVCGQKRMGRHSNERKGAREVPLRVVLRGLLGETMQILYVG
jgi:hypothetical protein